MRELQYLNYVKTPNAWKNKALEIPQQVQKNNSYTSKRRLGTVLVTCAIVVSLSGGMVYAVESGALGSIKAQLFDNKYTPYNYDNVQNDILEDTSILENYVQTDVKVTNLSISSDIGGVDFKVNSYLCDRDLVYISADLILPEGETYSGYNKNGANFEKFLLTPLDSNISIYGYGMEVKSVHDNVVSLVIYTISDGSSTLNGDINVSFSNLGSYGSSFETYFPMDVSFNLHVEDCGLFQSVENINKTVTLNNQSKNVTVSSVVYSPMMLNIYLTNLDDYTINSKDFTMYYIYSDGRKVFIPRDYMQTTYDINGNPTGISLNYAHANQTLIDFTNVVSIEINGESVVLK